MPRPLVHPTALVDPEARLADYVTVGPYAVIEGEVVVGPGGKIGPHVHLIGPLALGKSNTLHTGCVLGGRLTAVHHQVA